MFEREEQLILQLRRDRKLGIKRLRIELIRLYGLKLAIDTIGTVRNSVCGRAVDLSQAMAWVNRSSNRTANWALAMDYSRGGIFHSFSERFKTRNSSFMAASSLGK